MNKAKIHTIDGKREKEQDKESTYRDNATTIGEGVNPNSISFRGTHLRKKS